MLWVEELLGQTCTEERNCFYGEEPILTHPPPPQSKKKKQKEKMESTATSLESNTENGTAPFCAGLCAKRERERES